MKKIFIIGGMGAGKSMATKALVEQGLPFIDLDEVGHEVLTRDYVKADIVEAFGSDVLDGNGEVDRAALAAKAFVTEAKTSLLNSITMPRIEETFADRIDELEADNEAVVIEYSAFKSKNISLAAKADCLIAVLAPLDVRIERAVAAGWDEEDVKRRIARQITDADRIEAADVVFHNDSTLEELKRQVVAWWDGFKAEN